MGAQDVSVTSRAHPRHRRSGTSDRTRSTRGRSMRAPRRRARTATGRRVPARRTDVKLILRSDVDGLGKRGDIVDVADGYGRNYLLPRGMAFVATAGAVDQAAKMRRARDLRDAHDREAAQTVATTLVPKVITVSAKAGSEGRLFGSVTTAEGVDAVGG